jgi:putative DNA primase/helicase
MDGGDNAAIADAIDNAPLADPTAMVADDNERLDQLAQLTLIEYDRQRKQAAKELGISIATLDIEIKIRRAQLAAENGKGFLQLPEPWDDPVSGNKLLNELCATINDHMVIGEEQELAIALWILHTHAHNAARHSPILFINSPTKRCGKTNLLELLSRLTPKPLSAANVTPATVFRVIERWHPTMLIDETDTFVSDKSELRGVFNSGHTKSQAYVLRCVGDDLIPKQFSTWTPKAFAAIGRMHPTLQDRSIPIDLKRKLPTEKVKRIPKNEDSHLDLLRKCIRWSNDQFEALVTATPASPALNDRARDNWDPLLSIAEACGGDWAQQARQAAVKLSGFDDDETYSIQLLVDLKAMFESEGGSLSSSYVATKLGTMEDRPWIEFSNGKPISAARVAKLLKPFKVFPRRVKINDRWGPNGYSLKQLRPVFKRYLPLPQNPE